MIEKTNFKLIQFIRCQFLLTIVFLLSGPHVSILQAKETYNDTDLIAPRTDTRIINLDIPSGWIDLMKREAVQETSLEVLERDSWEISVNDGIATLTGTVDSWQKKQLAAKSVSGIPGIKIIYNNIKVIYATAQRDTEIKTEVEKALKRDALLVLINVSVSGSKVILTGVVESAEEKSRAISDSWVTGVESVDASGLEIIASMKDEQGKENENSDKNELIMTAVKVTMLNKSTVLPSQMDTRMNDVVYHPNNRDRYIEPDYQAKTFWDVMAFNFAEEDITFTKNVDKDQTTAGDKTIKALADTGVAPNKVPEPATLAMLSIGTLTLLRKRYHF